MKETHFFKDLFELQPGDNVLIAGKDFNPSFPDKWMKATILLTKMVDNPFSMTALCSSHYGEQWVKNLPYDYSFELFSIENQQYLWVCVSNMEVGDIIGEFGKIEEIQCLYGNIWNIVLTRFSDGKREKMVCSGDDFYHIRNFTRQ